MMKNRTFLVMLMFTMAVIASSCRSIPDYGVVCVGQLNGTLYAEAINIVKGDSGNSTNYSQFESVDGGLTWETSDQPLNPNCRNINVQDLSSHFTRETDITLYHFYTGERVDTTNQDDLAESTSYDLSQYRFDLRSVYWYRQFEFVGRIGKRVDDLFGDFNDYHVGPLDAVIDPETGNIIMAMSLDGVLIITPDGEQIWASVGNYQYVDLHYGNLLLLIDSIFLLAGLLFVLTGLTLLTHHAKGFAFLYLMMIWGLWFFIAFAYQPQMSQSIELVNIFLGFLILIIGRSAFSKMRDIREKQPDVILKVIRFTVVITLTFLLPYMVWMGIRIRDFEFAKHVSIALVTTAVFSIYWYIQVRYFPKPPKSIKPLEEEDNWTWRDMRFTPIKKHDVDSTVDPFEQE